MKLLADENVPSSLVDWLRQSGHDVLYAAEAEPGAADVSWLVQAEADERIVLTSAKDFGELIFRDRLVSHGIILLRLADFPIADAVVRLQAVWSIIEANPSGVSSLSPKRKFACGPFGARSWKTRTNSYSPNIRAAPAPAAGCKTRAG